jgi:alkylhydroperoxidase/carboxymuconolactone decarboxylase family protein YurZ
MALDELDRKQSALDISSEQRLTLLAYSERMASLAVRERSRELITLGLVALGVDGWRTDWRDNALIVSLHFDAAQRIGASPEAIFESAAQLLPEKPAHALRSFLRRSADDKSLGAMGYLASNDGDGFRYRRTW